jgi:hypothetical protein
LGSASASAGSRQSSRSQHSRSAAMVAATHQAWLIASVVDGRWPRPMAFPQKDAVLHAGVGAVADLEEARLPAAGVGREQLVAPPVGLLQRAQLRARRGTFTAAVDPHVGRPVRHRVPADRGAQQPGQLDHPGRVVTVEVAGVPVAIPDVLPVRLAQPPDRGPRPSVEVEPDRVVHAAPVHPRSTRSGG